jgi:hypothetical protein
MPNNGRAGGRPRGRGKGSYTMSDKARAARALTAKMFRPGRREDTPDEKARAYERDAIGRRLTLETTEQISEYLAANAEAVKRFRDAVRDPATTALDLSYLAQARMSPGELTRMFEAVQNRWGQPPRSVLEVDAAQRIPALFEVPLAGWESREGERAAATGNGHANGHTEH